MVVSVQKMRALDFAAGFGQAGVCASRFVLPVADPGAAARAESRRLGLVQTLVSKAANCRRCRARVAGCFRSHSRMRVPYVRYALAMHVARPGPPERAQRFISVCMEADRLLPDGDVEAWLARLERSVLERTDFVVHSQRDEETAMM